MSNAIERIKQRTAKEYERLSIAITEADKFTKQGLFDCIKELRDSSIEIIDEELAKEPQECKWTKGINSVETCWGDIDIKIFNQFKRQGAKFCPYCGRKIKVIE